MFEGLVTYSKVKRINRGCATRYTIKLPLRDQDYSNMIKEDINITNVITIKDTYSS